MSGWREAVAAVLSEPVSWRVPNPASDKTAITATTSPDPPPDGGFGGIGGFGADGTDANRPADRLALLAERPPPGVSPTAWRDRLDAGASFAVAWGEAAVALGWTDPDLYSLHPLAPLTRLDAMGAAYLTLRKTVVAVTADAVVLNVPPKGAVQRARKPTFPAPPAWETYA